MTELFVVASALKYSGIAGHSPTGLWVNSIVTVAAAVAQPPCLAAIMPPAKLGSEKADRGPYRRSPSPRRATILSRRISPPHPQGTTAVDFSATMS